MESRISELKSIISRLSDSKPTLTGDEDFVIEETDAWVTGISRHKDGTWSSPYMKSKRPIWVPSLDPTQIIYDWTGIRFTKEIAEDYLVLTDAVVQDCEHLRYLDIALDRGNPIEVMKLLLGPIASRFGKFPKEEQRSIRGLWGVINPYRLSSFVSAIVDEVLPKALQKEMFEEYINQPRLTIEELRVDPKFQVTKDNDLTNIIEKVIVANSSQWERAKTDEKLLHWFVGLVKKETKGQADAMRTRELLKQKMST